VPQPPLKYEPPSGPNGLTCFLNMERACGPDCMAFDAAPEGPDYKDRQWANCMLLVNAHRGGKHLIVLAQVGAEIVRKAKTEAADRARINQPPPPSPVGGG
jgi:hypothetical protein